MPNPTDDASPNSSDRAVHGAMHWHTFEEILRRLHQEGLYLHPHQLAEFFVWHGLPVELRYVPPALQQKATRINENYLGDMVRVETFDEPPWYSHRFL